MYRARRNVRSMQHIPTVHLLGSIGSAAAVSVRVLRARVRTRLWASVPPKHELLPGDLVVVDLNDRGATVEPRLLQPLLERATLCLIPGDVAVSPQWLELAAQPRVHVLSMSARRTGDVTVAELLRLIQGPSGGRVAELVFETEPALRFVQPLVEAVCNDPWSIRRPRDLALRTRMTLDVVRRQCVDLGFNRIEHFIICVRLLA